MCVLYICLFIFHGPPRGTGSEGETDSVGGREEMKEKEAQHGGPQ